MSLYSLSPIIGIAIYLSNDESQKRGELIKTWSDTVKRDFEKIDILTESDYEAWKLLIS